MAKREYVFSILLDPDPETGTYTVTVPALPGIVTQGDTIEDAIAMAKDAIRLHVEAMAAHGEPIPEERDRPQLITVPVPIHVAA